MKHHELEHNVPNFHPESNVTKKEECDLSSCGQNQYIYTRIWFFKQISAKSQHTNL